MVGRSSGCSLCVQRRVKCDERLPGCERCEIYGKPCPGYDRQFRFVAAKPYRTRRKPAGYSSDRTESNGNGNSSTNTNTNTNTNSSTGGSPENDDSQSIQLRQALVRRSKDSFLASGDMNVLQTLGVIIGELSQPFPVNKPAVASRWFGFLPSLYGRNRTLDVAIKSFTVYNLGNITQNQQMMRYARSTYTEALRRLQKSLNTPGESYSSEILCAVMLLSVYELFANTQDSEAWMKHAQGLSRLVQMRGLDRYLTDVDNVLLKASRGLIVMHSLFSGQSCFLASEEWHEVMRKRPIRDVAPELEQCAEELFVYITSAPSLVHGLFEIRDSDMTNPETWKRMSDMLAKALDLCNKAIAWYDRFCQITPPPSEVASASGDVKYPTVLHYSDVNTASLHVGYYSFMVIIHELLRVCGYPGEHEATVVYFRDQICKSVEYNGSGLLGPFRMGFGLRVSYEVADPATKIWIQSQLKRFSKIYAAAEPQNFIGKEPIEEAEGIQENG